MFIPTNEHFDILAQTHNLIARTPTLPMSRISIDVTPQQHKRLKALAALQGKSIKEFVLERTLSANDKASDEDKALKELESLLDQRLASAEASGASSETVNSIFEDAYRRQA